jgi:hypothetical protein
MRLAPVSARALVAAFGTVALVVGAASLTVAASPWTPGRRVRPAAGRRHEPPRRHPTPRRASRESHSRYLRVRDECALCV